MNVKMVTLELMPITIGTRNPVTDSDTDSYWISKGLFTTTIFFTRTSG